MSSIKARPRQKAPRGGEERILGTRNGRQYALGAVGRGSSKSLPMRLPAGPSGTVRSGVVCSCNAQRGVRSGPQLPLSKKIRCHPHLGPGDPSTVCFSPTSPAPRRPGYGGMGQRALTIFFTRRGKQICLPTRLESRGPKARRSAEREGWRRRSRTPPLRAARKDSRPNGCVRGPSSNPTELGLGCGQGDG